MPDLTQIAVRMAQAGYEEDTVDNIKQAAEKLAEPHLLAPKLMDVLFTKDEMAASNINGNYMDPMDLDPLD